MFGSLLCLGERKREKRKHGSSPLRGLQRDKRVSCVVRGEVDSIVGALQHQYNVTVMSQGRLSISCARAGWQAERRRDRSKGPAGVDVALLLLRICSGMCALCVCVCFYTEEP